MGAVVTVPHRSVRYVGSVYIVKASDIVGCTLYRGFANQLARAGSVRFPLGRRNFGVEGDTIPVSRGSAQTPKPRRCRSNPTFLLHVYYYAVLRLAAEAEQKRDVRSELILDKKPDRMFH